MPEQESNSILFVQRRIRGLYKKVEESWSNVYIFGHVEKGECDKEYSMRCG